DRAGGAIGRIELRHKLEGRVGVVDVVVGKLLALVLGRGGDAGAARAVGVEGGALMRILAVAKRLGKRSGEGAAPRRRVADRTGHPVRHGGVVGGGPGEGTLCELAAELRTGPAAMLV